MSLIGMGLNQEALDNLKPTSTVFEVQDMNAENGPTVVVDTDTTQTDENGRAVIDNFDDFNIVIQTFKDNEVEQVRLEDMAQVIMASESICQRDVRQFLDGISSEPGVPDEGGSTSTLIGFAEFFRERLPEASFTDEPSQINLPEAKRLVKRELDLRQTVRNDLCKAFMAERCDTFVQRAGDVLKVLATEIEEQESLRKAALVSQQRASDSKNFLAYLVMKSEKGVEQQNLYDIRHAPLDFYRLGKILDYGMGEDAELIIALGEYLRSTVGQAFIKKILTSGSYNMSFDSPYVRTTLSLMEQYGGSEVSGPNLSYVDIVSIYAKGDVESCFIQMKIYLESKVEQILMYKKYVADGEWGDANPPSVSDIIRFVTEFLNGLWDCAKVIQASESVRLLLYPAMAKMDQILYTPDEGK